MSPNWRMRAWSAASPSNSRTAWTATLMTISHRITGGRLIARSLCPSCPRSGPGRLMLSKGIGNSVYCRTAAAGLALRSALTRGAQAQAQRIQLDEAFGVALVVGPLVVLEGNRLHRVERLRRLAADHGRVALVELEPHRAADVLLALVDQRLQHLALGRVPESVVDQLGVFRHQLVL